MVKLSIIIPVYNVGKYIRRCLDSILDQTITDDFEVIMVDDGSTDDSGKICDEYAHIYNYFKVIHKENGGVSSARNAGLDIAIGEYVYFPDPDDYLEKDLLEILFDTVDKYPNRMPCARKVSFKEGETPIKFADMQVYLKERYATPLALWRTIYKRAIIEENKLRFLPICNNEDSVFNLEYMAVSGFEGTAVCGGSYYYMTEREDSICTSSKTNYGINNRYRQSIPYLQQKLGEFSDKGYDPRIIERLGGLITRTALLAITHTI